MNEFTSYIDSAQVVLYAFWIFFFGLILYLRREDKREGYPLDSDRQRVKVQGFPSVPKPKRFKLPHGGGVVSAPAGETPTKPENARPIAPWPGAPLEPVGDPMVAGVGPGSWNTRADHPDLTLEGEVKIVPLRVAADFSLAAEDVDPRTMPAVGGDGEIGGTISDVWVDRSEPQIRYLEVDAGGRRVLVPIGFAKIHGDHVRVRSIRGDQFARVPTTKDPDQVTLLEEDQISAYYGAGTLYAMEERAEPLL